MENENRPIKTHDLKTWMPYLAEISRELKAFDLRKDDRDFQVGDLLNLQEWDQGHNRYTGASMLRVVSYVLRGDEGEKFGLQKGFCVLGLRKINTREQLGTPS